MVYACMHNKQSFKHSLISDADEFPLFIQQEKELAY